MKFFKHDPSKFTIGTKAINALDPEKAKLIESLGYTKDVLERSRSPVLKITKPSVPMWNAVSKIDSLGSARKPVKILRADGNDSEEDKPKLASPTKKI